MLWEKSEFVDVTDTLKRNDILSPRAGQANATRPRGKKTVLFFPWYLTFVGSTHTAWLKKRNEISYVLPHILHRMTSTVRPIVIDDTDTAIKYTGQGWYEDSVGDGPGNWGTPYLHTRHGTTSNDSFSFSFTGQSSAVRCRSYPPRPISVQEHTSQSSARHL